MLVAVFMMGGLGIVVGVALAVASKIFYVYVDPKVEAVESALPGANCGGCGMPGCSANAAAIVAGKSSPNSCVAAGPEVAAAIAAILGVSVEAKEPDIAKPGCTFGVGDADTKYIYNGLSDCKAAALLSGGMKICNIGCLGLGSCAKACPFGAITMGPDRLPVVDEKRCTGCGTCERVCPKHIITLSSVTRRIIKEYTTEECTTPCQRACPAGINIREYIRQISLGDYHRSVQVIKERNPFPTVIGRICPRPCETECRRGLADEPVAINFLKRFVADYEKQSKSRVLPFKAPETDRKLAIIGGGVEGLSTAYFSARLGHSPTVFEATSKLGGLLRSAIAKYRLSQEILEWDIQGILDMGVKVETGKVMGKDFTIDSLLKEDFEAVFLASGGWDSRLTRGANHIESPVPDTFLLVDQIRFDTGASHKIFCKSNVVIVGGGKLALNGAKICKDLGSSKVTILLRESQDKSTITADDIAKLDEDGIEVIYGVALNRVMGKDNALTEVEYINLTNIEKTVIPAQTLFIASGRFPEMIFTKIRVNEENEEAKSEQGTPNTEPLQWEGIMPYKQPLFSDEIGLLSESDVLTDYSAAIKAIGAGRRGAVSLHQVINGISPSIDEKVIKSYSVIQNVDKVENVNPAPRKIMPMCNTEIWGCEEIEKGFTEEMARSEASRCLQCGLICYEHEK